MGYEYAPLERKPVNESKDSSRSTSPYRTVDDTYTSRVLPANIHTVPYVSPRMWEAYNERHYARLKITVKSPEEIQEMQQQYDAMADAGVNKEEKLHMLLAIFRAENDLMAFKRLTAARDAKKKKHGITVDAPDSPAEKEAERFADAHAGRSDAANAPTQATAGVTGIHASGTKSGFTLDAKQEERVDSALIESGSPLPEAQRKPLERSLGHDLSGVRIHTGHAAEHAADAIHAKAFTVGNDIVFGEGKYRPGTKEGDHLLAHEAAHVAQGRKNFISRRPKRKEDTNVTGRTVPYGKAYITEIGNFFVPSNIFYSLLYSTLWANKISRTTQILNQDYFFLIMKTWNELKSNQGLIYIQDDGKGYRKRILESFKKLMSTPRGRALVVEVASYGFPTVISFRQSGPEAVPENRQEATPRHSSDPGNYGTIPGHGSAGAIYIGPEIRDDTIKIIGPRNKIFDAPLYTILAHELAHVAEMQHGMATGEASVIDVINEIREEHGIDIRIDHRSCDTRGGEKCISIGEFHEGN